VTDFEGFLIFQRIDVNKDFRVTRDEVDLYFFNL
jgi:hypothetical protein